MEHAVSLLPRRHKMSAIAGALGRSLRTSGGGPGLTEGATTVNGSSVVRGLELI